MSLPIAIAVTMLTLCLTSCATMKAMTNEDGEVVRTVISRLCEEVNEESYYVLSSSSAVVDDFFVPSRIDDDTRRSLIARNSQAGELPTSQPCNEVLRRVDQTLLSSELQAAMQSSPRHIDQWSAFYAKFPKAKGIVRLSLPGYSTSGETAVVQVSIACGDVCKSVSFWVLERAGTRWNVTAFIAGPVS
jgi:hypothetical protein